MIMAAVSNEKSADLSKILLVLKCPKAQVSTLRLVFQNYPQISKGHIFEHVRL
jgi:hypothetical protein